MILPFSFGSCAKVMRFGGFCAARVRTSPRTDKHTASEKEHTQRADSGERANAAAMAEAAGRQADNGKRQEGGPASDRPAHASEYSSSTFRKHR